MNNAKTMAVAFCPIGSFLVKNGEPHIFPLRFVYAEDKWITEPVDPSGGDLVPIPDCVRKTTSSAIVKFNEILCQHCKCS